MKAHMEIYVLLAGALSWCPAAAQHLYFSNAPNLCCLGNCGVVNACSNYSVFVYSPQDTNFVGARFRFETDAVEELISFEARPGVTILGGNPVDGIRLAWGPRPLRHEPVLALTFEDSRWGLRGTEAWVRDAVLYRPSGDSLVVGDFLTLFAICHTFGCIRNSEYPDTADVVIDRVTSVDVRLSLTCDGLTGGPVDVTDENGWVESWFPPSMGTTNYEGDCFDNWVTVEICVAVPPGTAVGTTSRIDVWQPGGFHFQLRAVAPVPVDKSTWGHVKSLFRQD